MAIKRDWSEPLLQNSREVFRHDENTEYHESISIRRGFLIELSVAF